MCIRDRGKGCPLFARNLSVHAHQSRVHIGILLRSEINFREPPPEENQLRLRQVFLSAFAGIVVLFAASYTVWSQSAEPLVPPSAPSAPPVAPVRAVTDDYHGTKVVDPYRYMEDLKDPEVQAWFKGQNDYTRAVLAGLPGRAQLLMRIRELDQSVPLVSARQLPGDLYLIFKRLPTEDVGKLYLRSGLKGQDRLLVDPEKITLTAANQSKGKNDILGFAVSDDAQYTVCLLYTSRCV